jgi:hypothetical protein
VHIQMSIHTMSERYQALSPIWHLLGNVGVEKTHCISAKPAVDLLPRSQILLVGE